MAYLLVVVDDVAEVVAPAVVGFAHAHAVVGEVDVAVIAEEFGHFGRTKSVVLATAAVMGERIVRDEKWRVG